MRVLVTDGEHRTALAVVRSLGLDGHHVMVGAGTRRSLAGASRHCAGRITLPDPLAAPDAFAAAVSTAVAEHDVEMLFPVTDASMSMVLSHRAELEELGAQVPFADRESYTAISDKRGVLGRAAGLGIRTPKQVVVESPQAGLPEESLPYPVVLKPCRSVVGTGTGRRKTRVLYASDRAELAELLAAMDPLAYPVLLQERITGEGVGVFLLRWDDDIIAAFAHRRLREKPPSGGVSVLRESYPLDPGLYERSVALLAQHQWRGPAMIEYKLDCDSGTPYLMEVNGRYWGSLQLAIDAGVDFPALHVAAAAGERVEPVLEYPVGVTSRWVLGDLDHLIARLRHSREELGLPASAPGRVGAFAELVRGFGLAVHSEVFHWSDPRPQWVELWEWVTSLR